MWRILIAAVLILHGFGHVMGVFPVFGLFKEQGLSSRSWLLTNLLGEPFTSWLSLLFWLAALLGFVGAGLGVLNWLVPYEWWRAMAVVGAIASLMGLSLYWRAFFTNFNKLSAIGVDLIVLVTLLWLQWPTDAMLDS